MAYAGDWERGCALVERARQLNPNHPGGTGSPCSSMPTARATTTAPWTPRSNQHAGLFLCHAALAAVYGQLGETAGAEQPCGICSHSTGLRAAAREDYGRWFGPGQGVLEHVLDGLRKAGLDIPPA